MASVGLPAVVQVSTCAVCSTRGTNFYEVCDGSEGVVDKICPDCNGDEAVRKHLSDPEGLCPLCEVRCAPATTGPQPCADLAYALPH